MKIEIRQISYEIIEADKNDERLNVNGQQCLGVHNGLGFIYLRNDLNEEMKLRTLTHELTHAFCYQSAFNYEEEGTWAKTISEEMMCEFIACYGETIMQIVDEYRVKLKKETRCENENKTISTRQ